MMLKPSSVAWMRFLEFILTRTQATHTSVLLLFSFAALYLTLNRNLLTLNQKQIFSGYSWTKPAGGVTVCRQGWSDIAAELAELALVNQVDDVTTDQLMTTPYIQTKVQIQILFKSLIVENILSILYCFMQCFLMTRVVFWKDHKWKRKCRHNG